MDVANVPPAEPAAAPEIVGYLNFSTGNFDPRFYAAFDAAYRAVAAVEGVREPVWLRLGNLLQAAAARLQGTSPAFATTEQAAAVLSLTFDHLLPAYRAFHRDLLFHQT